MAVYLKVGQTQKLIVHLANLRGEPLQGTPSERVTTAAIADVPSWSSDQVGFASVVAAADGLSGVVTAVAAGTAIISVTSGAGATAKEIVVVSTGDTHHLALAKAEPIPLLAV